MAGQPGGAALVQALNFRSAQARHVGLDRVSGLDLQVGQEAVALGITGQQARNASQSPESRALTQVSTTSLMARRSARAESMLGTLGHAGGARHGPFSQNGLIGGPAVPDGGGP